MSARLSLIVRPMKGALARLLSSLIATTLGLGVFWLVFAAPNLLGRSELMLAWGWVGWIPAILLGFLSGKLIYRKVHGRIAHVQS